MGAIELVHGSSRLAVIVSIATMFSLSSIRTTGGAQVGFVFTDSNVINVVLRSEASSAVVGEPILLFGSVTPYNEGQRVYIYDNVGYGWESYASGTIHNGSFSITFEAKSPGNYWFKAAVIVQSMAYESNEIIVRYWPASIFSRLLIEDADLAGLSMLRHFRESLCKGSVLDRGISSAFAAVNGGLSFIADGPIWPVLKFGLYPALWALQASMEIFSASGNSAASLVFYGLAFGLVYLTMPIFLLGYFSKIGLTPTRWKAMLGIPAAISASSLLLLVVSPFQELACISALLSFASTALLPSLSLSKLICL